MVSVSKLNSMLAGSRAEKDNVLPANVSDISEAEGFSSIFNGMIGKSLNNKTLQNGPNNARISERLNLDIKRLAQFLGIGPKTLMAVMGKLKVNPENYDFKIQTNTDHAVNELAEYFGISPMTMVAVLDKLGIKPEDLEDKEKTGKIILELKELFGLSKDQEKDIRDILSKYAVKSVNVYQEMAGIPS